MAVEQQLGEVPALGALYARAVGRSGMLMLSRSPLRDARLPDTAYRVAGVRVDPTHLADYQHLLGEPGTDVLPAGFVHVLGFPLAMALMVREDFPLPVLGMVHVANRVRQRRALHLGEELTLRARATDLRAHRTGTMVDLVVTAGVGDEVAWEGVSTYLAKGRRLPGLPAAEDAPAPTADLTAATGRWVLERASAREYARVSGDRNPIHVSRLGARAFGFPRPIAHGMHTAALGLAAAGPARGGAFTWEVSFARPVLLPGTVDVVVTQQAGGHRFTGRHPRTGKVHLTGTVLAT